MAQMLDQISAKNIIFHDGEAFISEVYQQVLGRKPDPAGVKTGLNYLSAGGLKLNFILAIAESAEARSHTPQRQIADVSGLERRLLRTPILAKMTDHAYYKSAVLRRLQSVPQTSAVGVQDVNLFFQLHPDGQYSVADFFKLHDVYFVRAVYAALFGNQPDAFVEQYWTAFLRAGGSRTIILSQLLKLNKNIDVKGLWPLAFVEKLSNLPLIGNLLAAIVYCVHMKGIRRHMNRLENALFRKEIE